MLLSIITPTHNPAWLSDAWASLSQQSHVDFEWIVVVNTGDGNLERVNEMAAHVRKLTDDVRLRVERDYAPFWGVGHRKSVAFKLGKGEALIELDHDDMLLPGALSHVAKAFENPEIGFVYSDNADFVEGAEGQGAATYRSSVRPGWVSNGFTFYERELGGPRPGHYECLRSFPPSALAVSTVYWAPNHFRAWRRSVYEKLGGHNPLLPVCDDHELLIRTYLATRMLHIPEPLYLYRVSDSNTWQQRVAEIGRRTIELQHANIEQLAARESDLRGLPRYDLGGEISPASGWRTIDIAPGADVEADLRQKWPFADGSVGAFRACDFLEHLPDKQHTMREIWRCLAPGGWLLSNTPSADGRGADMDPTHVSRWNEPSFWYWTRAEQAKYIRNTDVRFQEVILQTYFPSDWHREWNISYVRAVLVALKPGYMGPGEKRI